MKPTFIERGLHVIYSVFRGAHMPGWNNWYHCIVSTYGAWLPGDSRGFRTRKHREHVEGDYKSPPPAGKYDQRHQASKEQMKRDVVRLPKPARMLLAEDWVASAKRYDIELLIVSISAMHLHLLGRFPMNRRNPKGDAHGRRSSAIDDPVRHLVGQMKQWSSKRLIREGLFDAGVWAKRGKIVPIMDRRHQVNVFKYIHDHLEEDAVVWTFKDGLME